LKEVILRTESYVRQRTAEFRRLGEEGKTRFDFRPFLDLAFDADLFSELCFCLLTANSSAITGLRIQASLTARGLMRMDYREIEEVIAHHGHRFPAQRAARIVEARERWERVKPILLSEEDSSRLRDLLSDPRSEFKIRGLGYKEASHFLRNTGRRDVAIVDRHIYRFLVENKLYPQVKTITPRRYRDMERTLEGICRELKTSQAELDLYIFFLKTGRILK